MATKKSARREPFLNTVARKLGRAAGTLTHVAQVLSENLAPVPASVPGSVQEATGNGRKTTAGKKKQTQPAGTIAKKAAIGATQQKKKKSTSPTRSRKPAPRKPGKQRRRG